MKVDPRMAAAPRHPSNILKGFPRLGAMLLAGICASSLSLLLSKAACAQIGSYRYSSIIVDDGSGKVAEAINADAPRYPASLTKLMTLYMAFEAIRDHHITLNQVVPVSVHAATREPSKLGLVPGTRVTVEDCILAIVTKSANDAASALGELIGGDEDRFGQMMTLRAKGLGMLHSSFRNASGLPDPEQVTTARDLALLAHHLIQDFPVEYHYFSVPFFYYHGREIPNHDHMLTDYEGADGLKTGYTLASGHNLVTSAVRGGVRLIGVVMGASSNPERDIHMASLLDAGFVQEGVPIAPHAPRHFRLPSLIEVAEAAPMRPHGIHGFHLVHGRLIRLALHRSVELAPAAPHATLAVTHAVVCKIHHRCTLHARRT